MDVGPAELILIAAVLLVLFGGKKLPELARGLGQAQREFRDAMRDEPEAGTSAPAPATEPTASEAPATATEVTVPDDDTSTTRDDNEN